MTLQRIIPRDFLKIYILIFSLGPKISCLATKMLKKIFFLSFFFESPLVMSDSLLPHGL